MNRAYALNVTATAPENQRLQCLGLEANVKETRRLEELEKASQRDLEEDLTSLEELCYKRQSVQEIAPWSWEPQRT